MVACQTQTDNVCQVFDPSKHRAPDIHTQTHTQRLTTMHAHEHTIESEEKEEADRGFI